MPLERARFVWRRFLPATRTLRWAPTTHDLWRIGSALVLASVAVSAFTVWRLWVDARADARADAHSLGVVVAEQTESSMRGIDLVLQSARANLLGSGVTAADAFRKVNRSRAAHEALVRQLATVPQADALILIGADGRMINFSRTWPAPDIEISDLSHFKYVRDHAHPGAYVSEPMISRASGLSTLYLVRRLSGPSGEFLGAIEAAIPLKYLDNLCSAVALTAGHGFTLLRRDGVVIDHCPAPDQVIARRMPAASPWHALVREGGGAYHSDNWLGAETEFVSVHPLNGYSLVVDTTISEQTAFAAWRREAALIALETLGGVLCITLLLRALTAKFRHLEQARTALAEKSRLLETTLENMDQGLMMVTPEQTVPVCNSKALEMLDLPQHLMGSCPRFADIVAYQLEHREFAADEPAIDGIKELTDLSTHPYCYDRHRPNGQHLEVRTVPMPGGGFVRTYSDVTERKAAERRIRYLAEHDELTGLANRALLREWLEHELKHRHSSIAVLCLDLDNFKDVNDTMGHAAGDALLRLVAQRLNGVVREGDLVARLGGDEFAILQAEIAEAADVRGLAARLEQALSSPFVLDLHQVSIGVSVGIAISPLDGDDADTLLKNADIALYRAKAAGNGSYRFFEPGMDAEIQERRALEVDLRSALARAEFELYFQPVLNARTRAIGGFEALLRWHHPSRGLVPPVQFIPLCEEIGLIVPIGEWVLREACRLAATWPDHLSVAVNLSPLQFRSDNLVQAVREALFQAALPATRLDVEITESVLLRDTAATLDKLHALRSLGVRISLDDFGTGYSSLGYLCAFPFDKIKIDKTFVRELHARAQSLAIVRSILQLGQSLGMSTTVEGVETEEQLALLQAEDCTDVQGFLFSEPRPFAETGGLIERFVGDRRLAA